MSVSVIILRVKYDQQISQCWVCVFSSLYFLRPQYEVVLDDLDFGSSSVLKESTLRSTEDRKKKTDKQKLEVRQFVCFN